eukprot:SAG22_NODE_13493_length_404_cov_2.072131_1_plen_119_part_01
MPCFPCLGPTTPHTLQYFECNYGNIGFPFDKWFGTIRHHIGDTKDYKGAGDATHGGGGGGGDNLKEGQMAADGAAAAAPRIHSSIWVLTCSPRVCSAHAPAVYFPAACAEGPKERYLRG